MNRREALASLASVPLSSIVSVERVNLSPTDVIVVQTERQQDQAFYARMYEVLKEAFPNNKVVVIDRDITLKVLRDGGL